MVLGLYRSKPVGMETVHVIEGAVDNGVNKSQTPSLEGGYAISASSPSESPAPSSLLVFVIALAGLLGRRRRS